MCGICGIIDLQERSSSEDRQQRVGQMNQALWHRGPDEAGQLADRICALAMRRLSIIDLTGGQQPIFNENETICVFMNGEIYNYPELRTLLRNKGHHFRTQSDTEVLVHLYEEHGEEMCTHLRGMFSFCLYDRKQQTFLLARDPFGEKPLYYHWQSDVFTFSSEIKSLLENPGIPRRLNHQALPYYLRTSLVPEPMTLLAEINSLPPGNYLKLSKAGLQIKAYFRPSYPRQAENISESEALERIKPLLQQAVQRQSRSDVRLGAFLSGGIDSSSIVALLQQQSAKPIPTFNVRFEEQAYDESPIARKVAEYCGTDHHEIVIPNDDFDPSIFWAIIEQVGLPFRDSSAIPSYLISKAIGQEVKVALSGDGGDELFGGYDLFQWYQKIIRLKQIPRSIRKLINGGLAWSQQAPVLHQLSIIRQLKRIIHTSLAEEEEIPIALNEFFKPQSLKTLLPTNGYDNRLSQLRAYPDESCEWTPLRKIMYYRTIHTLPANMLVKIDRMSMAHSLEVRAPFLDLDLFNATIGLPDELMIRQGKGKYLLRKMMQSALPEEVFNHPKTGFNLPLFRYQNTAFKQLARELLFDHNPLPNLFPKKALEAIYQSGITNRQNTASTSVFQSAHQLWMMMQLMGWAKRFKITV